MYIQIILDYRTIQSKRQEHHEEDQRPKRASGHRRYRRRIHNEHQSRTLGGHLVDVLTRSVCHIAEYREYHKSGTETGHRIDDTRQYGVPKKE